ncbi:MAG: rRNA pseudouridine synthase [Nitrospirae bacterium]|nr:rRNA pseudouridine synthase [Nitrospirota bacterium]
MGAASRRKAEELIADGRVTVNGAIAHLGDKADPGKDHIKLDGKLLIRTEPKVYYMLHKPVGVVTSLSDPGGRPTIKDFLKGIRQRVYPVGRLDYDSEGLLLITNDGELTYSLLHPSKKIPKTYLVKVKGAIGDEDIKKIGEGVWLKHGKTAPAKVRRLKGSGVNTWVELTIYEGKKRQIRLTMERVGHPVIRLKRIAIKGLKLGNLETGQYRALTPEEIKKLRN